MIGILKWFMVDPISRHISRTTNFWNLRIFELWCDASFFEMWCQFLWNVMLVFWNASRYRIKHKIKVPFDKRSVPLIITLQGFKPKRRLIKKGFEQSFLLFSQTPKPKQVLFFLPFCGNSAKLLPKSFVISMGVQGCLLFLLWNK